MILNKGMRSLLVAAMVLQGCATVKQEGSVSGEDAQELARQYCSSASSVKGVEGRVWMKAKSKEASGQFPAVVKASQELGLTLEVTQLMGARAALIEIRGNEFKVETPSQGSVSKKARAWGGIPLEWAGALFMNRLPCPDLGASSFSWSLSEKGELRARSRDGTETWTFSVVQRQGSAFVEKVVRERQGKVDLELNREDPDPQDGWARRWEIKSGVGEVKVRWRDRKTL
jgi:hypothetical protein